MKVWHTAARRMMGETAPPVATPQKGDYRFKDAAWEENFLFDYIKQSSLVTSSWLQSPVHEMDGAMEEKTKTKDEFYTPQFVTALSPSTSALQLGKPSGWKRMWRTGEAPVDAGPS